MSNPRISQVNPSQPITSTPQVEGQPTEHARHRHKAAVALFQQSTFGQSGSSGAQASPLLSSVGQDGGSTPEFFSSLSDDDQTKLSQHSQDLASAIWTAVGVVPPFATTPPTDEAGQASTSVSATTQSLPRGRSLAQASIQIPGVYTGTGSGSSAGGSVGAASTVPVGIAGSTSSTQLTGAVQNTMSTLQNVNKGSTFDTNVASTAYLGLLGLDTDLKNYAGVVQGQLATSNQARVQFSTIQDTVANWPTNQDTVQFTWTELDGNGQAVQKSGALTKDQAQAKLDNLQQTISQLGSQTQEQQLTLQDLTNKYQQGVETLTNVLKFQFDTTKSIISNIKT